MRFTSTDIQLKLETAVLTACRQSLPLDNLEVDAIICVNVADKKEEHVVKIHQRFDVCGPADRNTVKVKEEQTDVSNVAIGVVGFETGPVHKPEKKEVFDENERCGFVSENQNEQHVQAMESKGHETKEDGSSGIKGSNKSSTDLGRSSSRHPRKSSTPRCLNPKHRQQNYNNSIETIKEKQYEFIEKLSASNFSLLNNDYGTNDSNEEHSACSDVLVTKDNDNFVMNDTHNENYIERPNLKNKKYIEIEPNSIDRLTAYTKLLPEKELSDFKGTKRKLDTNKDNPEDLNPFSNDYTIELNSDSESYDTTYNYTFDKSVDEALEENSQVIMKSLDDSDDQSLGSSPSDLTNSMVSYNVSHIIPSGGIGEGNDILLDIPTYTGSPKSKAGGKWNDLTSNKRSDIPSGVENLSCRTCGAMFSSTRTRRRHENSTCGAIRYSCVVCSKLFSRKDARRRHMMRMHPLEHRTLLENQQSPRLKAATDATLTCQK